MTSKPFDYRKYEYKRDAILKDPRSHMERLMDKLRNPHTGGVMFMMSAAAVLIHPWFMWIADFLLFYNGIFFIWLVFLSRKYVLPYKMPKTANRIDPHNRVAGGSAKPADGILYIGNEEKTGEEIWFTNSDARTHILYLGTTGSGKTEGLKSLATNALGWGSGFIYVDGKADTDLWGALSGLARRFGRDDDLLVLNYMTGNSDAKIASNTINPFAQGSASYLTNLLVSLMPEIQGENAMWKDRAVALISALMPVLTWQRSYQEKVLNINTIRDSLIFKKVIELSRLPEVPDRLRKGVRGYLDTLPGYTDAGFNDDGTEKPAQGGPPMDYATIYQQHGYLAMQFTRQLQSLADDYGYIFETPSADIDMMDVVLNRRIVVVLIPALEKSADETANLGKIVGSMLKGMMGATLGSTVEGDTEMALENKPTRSSTPFMAIFDEVGYYTTQGMAVMAAQARSLGFCLVFAGQDLPALEKRVKEEARSITANCNLKIFGKLEDPTQTKEFFEKTVGETTVIEAAARKEVKYFFGQKGFDHNDSFNVTSRAKASYDQLKSFKEGQSIVSFGDRVVQAKMFYSNVGKIKSLRVNKFITLPHPDPTGKRSSVEVDAIMERIRDKGWTAENAARKAEADPIIDALSFQYKRARHEKLRFSEAAAFAVTNAAFARGILTEKDLEAKPTPTPAPAAAPKPESSASSSAPKQIDKPKDDDNTLNRVDSSKPKPKEDEAMAAGTAETISWGSLLDEDSSSSSSGSKSPAKALTKEQQEALPSIEESVSWKDLMGGDEKPSALPKEALQGLPPSGFGIGGFGSGFGGIGGISFPTSRQGGATPAPAAPKEESKPAKPDSDKAIDEKLEKASQDGETVNWKDLF